MAEVLYTWATFYTQTIEVVVALRRSTLLPEVAYKNQRYISIVATMGLYKHFHSESQIVYLPVQKGKAIHNPFLLV